MPLRALRVMEAGPRRVSGRGESGLTPGIQILSNPSFFLTPPHCTVKAMTALPPEVIMICSQVVHSHKRAMKLLREAQRGNYFPISTNHPNSIIEQLAFLNACLAVTSVCLAEVDLCMALEEQAATVQGGLLHPGHICEPSSAHLGEEDYGRIQL